MPLMDICGSSRVVQRRYLTIFSDLDNDLCAGAANRVSGDNFSMLLGLL